MRKWDNIIHLTWQTPDKIPDCTTMFSLTIQHLHYNALTQLEVPIIYQSKPSASPLWQVFVAQFIEPYNIAYPIVTCKTSHKNYQGKHLGHGIP